MTLHNAPTDGIVPEWREHGRRAGIRFRSRPRHAPSTELGLRVREKIGRTAGLRKQVFERSNLSAATNAMFSFPPLHWGACNCQNPTLVRTHPLAFISNVNFLFLTQRLAAIASRGCTLGPDAASCSRIGTPTQSPLKTFGLTA